MDKGSAVEVNANLTNDPEVYGKKILQAANRTHVGEGGAAWVDGLSHMEPQGMVGSKLLVSPDLLNGEKGRFAPPNHRSTSSSRSAPCRCPCR